MDKTKTKTVDMPCIFRLSLAMMLAWLLISVGSDAEVVMATFPPNDICTDATAIGDVTDLPFDTKGARFGGRGLCMVGPNIWYCYTAPCTGDVTVSLAGSSFDTMLAVYRGCECFPTPTDFVACNDDFGNSFQSQITFPAIAGNQYLIEVGGYGSEEGKGFISINCEGEPVPPPAKDDCSDARPVGDVKDLEFDTSQTTFDGPGLCMTSPNTWYCYTASCTGDAIVSLLGSSYDTMLAVYNGCDCPQTSSDLIACNDDFGNSFQSQLTFPVIAGNQYLIEVGGYGSETGQGVLNISCEGTVVTEKPDLGDAPDSGNSGRAMSAYFSHSVDAYYPTIFDDGGSLGPFGPLHINDLPLAHLGKQITAETEAHTGPDEDRENNIQPQVDTADRDGADDGVVVPLKLPGCAWSAIDYEVAIIEPGTALWVNVWLDFNRDGDWDDVVDCPSGPVREWAVRNQYLYNLPTGLNKVTTPGFMSWHPDSGPQQIWMRITLAEQPWVGGSNPGERGNAGSGPDDGYQIGETEDYIFVPDKTPDKNCPLCRDVDGNGVIDLDDLILVMTEWLSTCQ